VTNYIRTCDACQRAKVEQASPADLMGRRIADRSSYRYNKAVTT